MHPLTIEKSSSPTTIRGRVGAQRALECGGSPPLSGGSVKIPPHSHVKQQNGSKLPHSKLPRFVVTLDSSLTAGETLARIPLAVTGKWVRDGNDFSITLGDLEEIVSNFRKRRNGEINVDYDHASEMPEVAAGGPIPSAGRITALRGPEPFDGHPRESWGPVDSHLRGNDGRWILWGVYEPTERARQLIESREYRYISPAINWAGRDKRTGRIAGTTLTSVALTNRPFLEELPQIRLSDPAYQLVDIGEVHVETSLGQPDAERGESGVRSGFRTSMGSTGLQKSESQKSEGEGRMTNDQGRPSSSITNHQSQIANLSGGLMKQVNLSIEDGKVRVGHGDFTDAYYADPQEMKQCLDHLGVPADQPLAQELAELAGMPAGASAEAEGAAGAGPSTTLSECVAEIRRRLAAHQEISLTEAGALLSENETAGKSIPAADFFRWKVEQELDDAVKSGKCLPRQREDWRKIALSDFPTFRKIVAAQKPQVPLRPTGLSGSGPEDAQTQVKLLAEQRMRDRQISFGQALSEIGREQPELVHQYRRSVSGGE